MVMRVAVIGAGVVGLATTAALLDRGVQVVCFEKLAPMAERSAGESRIFRLAHRDPELVDLAGQARRIFADWEAQAGTELIDPVGVVISGEGWDQWSAAMAAAGAEHQEVGPESDSLRLPTRKIPAVSVIDPAGGVLRVARIGALLEARCQDALRIEHVYALEEVPGGVVVRSSGSQDTFDAVVLCAGAWTASLAVQVGLHPPIALAHHARFTFEVRPQVDPRMQAWLTTSAEGLSSYQHTNAPGQWAVGVHVDPAQVTWEVGADKATALARDITAAYVRSALEDVHPEVIDELYCTVNPDLGDGVQFLRGGRVLTVHGENLFKLAPLIGDRLAKAVVDGSQPAPMGSLR